MALKEGGVTKEDFAYLVDSGISFYERYMPPSWKKLIVQDLEPHADSLKDESYIYIFVEAIGEAVPWFPEVVTADKAPWLQHEMELIRQDIKKWQDERAKAH